jgi:hypothetical protein
MAAGVTVRVRDETAGGKTTNELSLSFLDERMTVRELIRGRVYQEVTEYNAKASGRFHGLVQPTDAERLLNGQGYQLRKGRRIDWEAQLEKALRVFQGNGYLLLVDDRQVTDLDEVIELRHDSSVSFLRLVPLVGG